MSTFRLEELGWKAFQDLCGTIAREILGQTVVSFSEGADAGRDGAFECHWTSIDGQPISGPTVIQCKHFTSPNASLTPSRVADELMKISELVRTGRCESYVLMSNGRLSARSETKIRQQVLDQGVEHCLILGSEWIERIVVENRRLRGMVPRIYGLGDLTEIIDARAYEQAVALLATLRYDIETFVPTASYRRAVGALSDHGLVLLLGEPAAGKSVIAATLALNAADRWGCRILRPPNAAAFSKHWNPQGDQFVWIDDAFGSTQFEVERTAEWNAVLPDLRAAVNSGARIVITSRDYIWNAARPRLKLASWPELHSGEVIVDVEDLTVAEKEHILYNHMRVGRQPRTFKRRAKPYLSHVATNPRFLPETARRLADPKFTTSLTMNEADITNFVVKPERFLLDVVTNLDDSSRAALTLLVMSEGDLPSPLTFDPNQIRTLQMLGVTESQARGAFTALDGSLVKLSVTQDGSRAWVPRHPTMTDAMTSLMRTQPELLEVYLRMAELGRLLREIDCGRPHQHSVSVPPYMHDIVLERLEPLATDSWPSIDDELAYFLYSRSSPAFLRQVLGKHPNLIDKMLQPDAPVEDAVQIDIINEAAELGFVTEMHLDQLAAHVSELSATVPDASIVTSETLRAVLGTSRTAAIVEKARQQLTSRFYSIASDWKWNYSDDYEPSDYLDPLRTACEQLGVLDGTRGVGGELDELESELNANRKRSPSRARPDHEASPQGPVFEQVTQRSIFDDVDA